MGYCPASIKLIKDLCLLYIMSDELHFTKVITLRKDFLIKIHSHELLTQIKGISDDKSAFEDLWKDIPEISSYSFGGVNGKQFTSLDQYISFDKAFDNALVKHKINNIHKNPLLYLIGFIGEDYQAQSIERNRFNRLKEYTRFILDLQANCWSHFESMTRNSEYQMIHDEATTEYFFAKKILVDSMPLDEIIDYRPNKTPGDLVQYLRVKLYETELYVPNDMMFSIVSDRKLKTFGGEESAQITIPHYLQSEVFKFTIDYILDEHKRYNTDFYKALNKPGLMRGDFTAFYNQYKKHSINYPQSMLRVGKVISDYFSTNKLSKNKSSIAAFLFDYFSLFKVIPLKTDVEYPIDYMELSNFYNRNGITKDTIRYMMKDAVIVGGI